MRFHNPAALSLPIRGGYDLVADVQKQSPVVCRVILVGGFFWQDFREGRINTTLTKYLCFSIDRSPHEVDCDN